MDPAYPVADLRKPKRNKLVKKAFLARTQRGAYDPILPTFVPTRDVSVTRDPQQWPPILVPGPSPSLKQTPLSSQRVELRRTPPPRPAADDLVPMLSLLSRKKRSGDGQKQGSFDNTFARNKSGTFRYGIEATGPLVQGSTRSTSGSTINAQHVTPLDLLREHGFISQPPEDERQRTRRQARDAEHDTQDREETSEWPLPDLPAPARGALDMQRALPPLPSAYTPRVLPWSDAQPHQRSQSQTAQSIPPELKANRHVRNFSSANRQFYEADPLDPYAGLENVWKQGQSALLNRRAPFLHAAGAQSAPNINALVDQEAQAMLPVPTLPRIMTELSPATATSDNYSPSIYDGSPVLQHHIPAAGMCHELPAQAPLSLARHHSQESSQHGSPQSSTGVSPLRPSRPQIVVENDLSGFDFGVENTQASLQTSSSRLSTISELSSSDIDGLSSYEVSPIDETDISLLELDDLPDYKTSQEELVNAKRAEDERRAHELRTMWLATTSSGTRTM